MAGVREMAILNLIARRCIMPQVIKASGIEVSKNERGELLLTS